MQRTTLFAATLLALTAQLQIGQVATPRPDQSLPDIPRTDIRLPNGKLQVDEMLKADRADSVKDVKQLLEIARALQQDLDEESAPHVLSIADIHRTEEIERLAKRIRGRLRRF